MKNELIRQNTGVQTYSPATQKAVQQLAIVHQKIIHAALEPKVQNIEPMPVLTELITVLATVYTIAGQKPDESTLAVYVDEFYSRVMEKFSFITVGEIKIALRNGVYGEYGEYYGLNPKTFVEFISKYLKSEDRLSALGEYNQKILLINDAIEYTNEEKEKHRKEFINILFKDHLQGRLLVQYVPTYLFDFLTEIKLITSKPDEDEELQTRGKSLITSLKNGASQSSLNHMEAKDILRAAKQISIIDFFEYCKQSGKSTIF